MSSTKGKSLSDLTFEEKDLTIFQIQDVATRLNTIQNYFFPRLDSLITHTLDLVAQIYNIDPYERMTILRTPRHRKEAQNNKTDRPFVRIGVGGKRNHNRNLKTVNKYGVPYKLLQGRLYYLINPNGEVSVYLWILGNIEVYRNRVVLSQWRELIKDHFNILNIIFNINHIAYPQAQDFLQLDQILEEPYIQNFDSLQFCSSSYFLPISFQRGIFYLQLAFIALYPLLVTSIDLEEGNTLRLREMLEQYLDWYGNRCGRFWWDEHSKNNLENEQNIVEIPQLDSYQYIKTGLWWDVLARDKWTCCSCGRSVREHGITLHVDHIIPRSKGGKDKIENLQALCVKCNIGKSNRDATVLSPNV